MQSATSIQVEGQEGAIMECTTHDTIEQTDLSEIHEKLYTLAGKAPICNRKHFKDLWLNHKHTCLRYGARQCGSKPLKT